MNPDALYLIPGISDVNFVAFLMSTCGSYNGGSKKKKKVTACNRTALYDLKMKLLSTVMDTLLHSLFL